MNRDFIGDGINRTPSEHDAISFSKTPSRRSLLLQRVLSVFCCNVSQMTPTVPRWNMQTTSSKQSKETASEGMSGKDSGNNNQHHRLGLSREDLLRFQNLSTDQVSSMSSGSPTIESFFPPQDSAKRAPRPQNRYTDNVSPGLDTKMPPAMPVRRFAVDNKTRFSETDWERDFVSIQPAAGYPRIIPAPFSGDQNSYLNSSESIEDTFPAQISWGPYSSHAPRRQRRQLQDTRERDWEQSKEIDEKISVGR